MANWFADVFSFLRPTPLSDFPGLDLAAGIKDKAVRDAVLDNYGVKVRSGQTLADVKNNGLGRYDRSPQEQLDYLQQNRFQQMGTDLNSWLDEKGPVGGGIRGAVEAFGAEQEEPEPPNFAAPGRTTPSRAAALKGDAVSQLGPFKSTSQIPAESEEEEAKKRQIWRYPSLS